MKHLLFLEKLNLIKRKGENKPHVRYGYNLHEFRDVAKTLLHLQGVEDGLDLNAIKFFMGHGLQIDPNKYDKFYMDQEYMLDQ